MLAQQDASEEMQQILSIFTRLSRPAYRAQTRFPVTNLEFFISWVQT
uniref:Uncharacterized protein n=1 Tax=Romanomermis culicivorax TaxID=13658 RepID=A0A915KVC0_ROMCU